MAILGIHYTIMDNEIIDYKSVNITYCDLKEHKTFATGNFVKDWFDMSKFMITEVLDKEPFVSHSSSINHFIMDGAPYDSAYLHMVDGKPVLKYFDRSDPNWFITQRDIEEDGMELFVPENTQPTWEELKEMCK